MGRLPMTAEEVKPLIALDYDGTVTTNLEFWLQFIKMAEAASYRICIVTMRYPEEKDTMDPRILEACPWVITTERQAKAEFCAKFDIFPSIWVDDQPFFIYMDAKNDRPTDPDSELPVADRPPS